MIRAYCGNNSCQKEVVHRWDSQLEAYSCMCCNSHYVSLHDVNESLGSSDPKKKVNFLSQEDQERHIDLIRGLRDKSSLEVKANE